MARTEDALEYVVVCMHVTRASTPESGVTEATKFLVAIPPHARTAAMLSPPDKGMPHDSAVRLSLTVGDAVNWASPPTLP
jgi:hypothetical protein